LKNGLFEKSVLLKKLIGCEAEKTRHLENWITLQEMRIAFAFSEIHKW